MSKAALKKQQKKDAKKAAKGGAPAAADGDKPSADKKQDKPAEAPKSVGIATMELKSGYFQGPIADLWEEVLDTQQWLGGSKLTQADVEATNIIKGQFPNPNTHPNLFAWCAIATKFMPSVSAKWPAAECPLPKSA